MEASEEAEAAAPESCSLSVEFLKRESAAKLTEEATLLADAPATLLKMVVEPMVEVMVDPPVVSTVTIAEVVMAEEEPPFPPAPACSQVSHVPTIYPRESLTPPAPVSVPVAVPVGVVAVMVIVPVATVVMVVSVVVETPSGRETVSV